MNSLRSIAYLALALFGLLLTGCGTGEKPGYLEKPGLDFTVSPLRPAGDVKLSDYKGKVVLIDFWATWCGPCRMLMPHLSELQEKYRSQGLVVLGISNEARATVAAFHEQHPELKYDLFLDPHVDAAKHYNAVDLPTTVIVDRGGVVKYYDSGYSDDIVKEIDETVARLVKH